MSRPRALLINPWIYDFAAYNLWFRPLGLLYLGGWLERQGFDISLIDCLAATEKERQYGAGNFRKEIVSKPSVLADVPRRFGRYGMPVQEFTDRLAAEPQPDIVCITSQMTYWYPGVELVVQMVRDRWPAAPVLLGGIYASLCPDHAVQTFGSDAHVFSGPFEKGVGTVLEKLGFSVGSTGNARSLFGQGVQPVYHCYDRLPYAAILSTRGCPYNCHYCASDRLYDRFETGDPAAVVSLVADLSRTAGVKDFAFFDDALLCNPERHFIPLAEHLIRAGTGCRFHLPNGISPRLITPQIADLMFRAGFITIRLSFETVRQERLDESSRKVVAEDLARAAGNLRRAGFGDRQLEAYVLMGVPEQDIAEVAESMLYVRSCGAYPLLASYALIPGTPYYQRSLDEMGLQELSDPLLHNNSTYPLWRKKYSWDTINAVNLMKRQIHALAPEKGKSLDPAEAAEDPVGFLNRLRRCT